MAFVIDVQRVLVPLIARHAQVWRAVGVEVTSPWTVLALASGQHEVTADQLDAVLSARGERERVAQDAADPRRVLESHTLRGGSGVILLGSGGFGPDDTAVAIDRTWELYAGQRLLGIGPCEGGTVLESSVFDGPAIRLLDRRVRKSPFPAQAGERVGGRHAIEGVYLRHVGGAGVPESTDGIVVSGAERSLIERVRVEGFGRGLVLRDGTVHASVQQSVFRALRQAVAFEDAQSCRLAGCRLEGASPGEGADACVVRMAGEACSLVRCHVSEDPGPVAGASGAGRLVQVLGHRNVATGCTFAFATSGEPAITIGRSGAEAPEGTVLERNVYLDGFVTDQVREAGDGVRSARVADHGYLTSFRDATGAGFPPISVSSHNLLVNGSFEESQRPVVAHPRPLPGPDALLERVRGHLDLREWFDLLEAREGVPGPRERPLAWTPRPGDADWGDRAAFERAQGRVPVAVPFGAASKVEDAAPAAARLAAGRYWDLGEAPGRPTFRSAVPLEELGRPEREFGATGDAHHGRRALWLGVADVEHSDAGRGKPEAFEAVFEQTLRLPLVAREFVASAFVKARGPGSVFIRLREAGGATASSAPLESTGQWQQRTVLYRPRRQAGGPVDLRIQCVVRGSTRGFTEALFDRMVLVPGCYVPHFAEPSIPEEGADVRGAFTASRGRKVELPLHVESLVTRGFQPEEVMAVAVTTTPMTCDEDVLVSATWRGGAAASRRLHVDLRRNGESVLVGGRAWPVEFDAARGAVSVGRVPLSAVRGDRRRWVPGDVASLHWCGASPVEDLHVVVGGTQREFRE